MAAASPRSALQDVSRMPQFNSQLLRKSVSPCAQRTSAAGKRQRTSFALEFDDDLPGLSQMEL